MSKIRIIILLVLTILLTSCQFNQTINYSIIKNDIMRWENGRQDREIVKEESELKCIVNKKEILNKYNSEYFDKNALIVFETSFSFGGGVLIIESYKIVGEKIKVFVEVLGHGNSLNVEQFVFLLELEKEIIKNVSEIEIYQQGKILNEFTDHPGL